MKTLPLSASLAGALPLGTLSAPALAHPDYVSLGGAYLIVAKRLLGVE